MNKSTSSNLVFTIFFGALAALLFVSALLNIFSTYEIKPFAKSNEMVVTGSVVKRSTPRNTYYTFDTETEVHALKWRSFTDNPNYFLGSVGTAKVENGAVQSVVYGKKEIYKKAPPTLSEHLAAIALLAFSIFLPYIIKRYI